MISILSSTDRTLTLLQAVYSLKKIDLRESTLILANSREILALEKEALVCIEFTWYMVDILSLSKEGKYREKQFIYQGIYHGKLHKLYLPILCTGKNISRETSPKG